MSMDEARRKEIREAIGRALAQGFVGPHFYPSMAQELLSALSSAESRAEQAEKLSTEGIELRFHTGYVILIIACMYNDPHSCQNIGTFRTIPCS